MTEIVIGAEVAHHFAAAVAGYIPLQPTLCYEENNETEDSSKSLSGCHRETVIVADRSFLASIRATKIAPNPIQTDPCASMEVRARGQSRNSGAML